MTDLSSQIAALKSSWKAAYDKANAAPAAWQPYWPQGSLVVLDEVVSVLAYWSDRVRAPSGFSPGFQLAHGLSAASMPALLATAQQIAAGNFNHLPAFVNQLIGALSAVHSMAVYSNKDDALQVVGDMQAQLAEALAVLGTAQREFAEKATTLERIDAVADKIEDHLRTAEATATSVQALHDELLASQQAAKANADAIAKLAVESAAARDRLVELTAAASDTRDLLKQRSEELHALLEAAEAQSQTIDSILPKAASAGLAAAFSARGSQLEGTKKLWASAFIGSLVLLALVAFYVFRQSAGVSEDFWQHLALRLTLAAPLVWLGWFSAVQYGNIVRVQEDYAFKEATSRAFQGYRDHMEHLGTIDVPEAGKALNLLAVRTIEILSHEPLRIYGRTDKDASPAHSIVEALTKRTRDGDQAKD